MDDEETPRVLHSYPRPHLAPPSSSSFTRLEVGQSSLSLLQERIAGGEVLGHMPVVSFGNRLL